MCGPQCESLPVHEPECLVVQQTSLPIEITDFDRVQHTYESVCVLRCLLLKKRSPRKWRQLLQLQDHCEQRRGTERFRENQTTVVGFLRNYVGLSEFSQQDIDFSEETIHRVCGILDTNSIEEHLPTSEVQVLFPTASLLEHSCLPNTRFVFAEKLHLTVLAALPVRPGDHIGCMYTNPLWGTSARRDHLKHHKHFLCQCPRCLDPSEMGTNFSTLKCQKCAGNVLSADSLLEAADYYCEQCGDRLAATHVTDLILRAGEEIELMQQKNSTIAALEGLLQKYSRLLHPNHYHKFMVKHALLQLYGREEGYQLFDLTHEQLERKEQLCRDVIWIGYRIDPGMSGLQGYIGAAYMELHTAILELARQRFQDDRISMEELRARAEESRECLLNAIKILQYERPSLPEGQMAAASRESLADFDKWLDKIGCFVGREKKQVYMK